MTPFERRLRACQDSLDEVGADLAVLFPSPNMYYVSGFEEEPMERHLFLFVPAEGDPVFVAPTMYDEQIAGASWIADVRTWADGDDPRSLVETVVGEFGTVGSVLVDDRMWARFTQDLRVLFPDATFGLASEVFDDLRMRKDEHELATLRETAAIADRVMERVRELGEDAVGMTERELALFIEDELHEAGGDRPSFDVIVGSGPNGAMPHYRHGDREIRRGEPVVLDFGAFLDHYPSDQTRTVVFDGDPPEGFEDAFAAVLEAQKAGVDAVEPGVQAETVDAAARTVIEDRGYGDAFLHRTGHGLGLEVHEAPYIVAGNEQPLEPGMVFSVEPGVYLDGEYGIRIEDIVVVTEDGCDRLNTSSRQWRVA